MQSSTTNPNKFNNYNLYQNTLTAPTQSQKNTTAQTTIQTPANQTQQTPQTHTHTKTKYIEQTPLSPNELAPSTSAPSLKIKQINLSSRNYTSNDVKSCFKLYPHCTEFDFSRNFVDLLPVGVGNLQGIVKLDLSYNELTSLSGFEALVKLKYLDVSHNTINSLNPLSQLTALITLNCSDNGIKTIAGLENSKSLTTLNISNNLIKAYTQIRSLSLNAQLKRVDFSGNLLAGLKGFKFKVIHFLVGCECIGDNVVFGVDRLMIDSPSASASASVGGGSVGASVNLSSPGSRNSSYKDKGIKSLINSPDERIRSLIKGENVNGSGNEMINYNHASGHGSGSKVTELNSTNVNTQRILSTTSKNSKKMMMSSTKKERYPTKALPWRAPPAPMPHMTVKVGKIMDDSSTKSSGKNVIQGRVKRSQQGQVINKDNGGVWWTPSSLNKEFAIGFKPKLNVPVPDAIIRRGRKGEKVGTNHNISPRKNDKGIILKKTESTFGRGHAGGNSSTKKADTEIIIDNEDEPQTNETFTTNRFISTLGSPFHHTRPNTTLKPNYIKPPESSRSLINDESTPRKYILRDSDNNADEGGSVHGNMPRSLFNTGSEVDGGLEDFNDLRIVQGQNQGQNQGLSFQQRQLQQQQMHLQRKGVTSVAREYRSEDDGWMSDVQQPVRQQQQQQQQGQRLQLKQQYQQPQRPQPQQQQQQPQQQQIQQQMQSNQAPQNTQRQPIDQRLFSVLQNIINQKKEGISNLDAIM